MSNTIKDLEQSKIYVRNGSPALHPMDYLEPVITEIESRNWDYVIKTSNKIENQNDDGSTNISYGRVIVEAKIPASVEFLQSDKTVGFVYALDKTVPEFVIYGGHTVRACTNLCVYGDEMVERYLDNHYKAQDSVKSYMDKVGADDQRYVQFYNKLQNFSLEPEQLDKILGKLLQATCTKHKLIGLSPITHAAKELFDGGSPYAVKNEMTDMWNVYGAITDYYSKAFKEDKGFLDRPKKTKELYKLITTLVN